MPQIILERLVSGLQATLNLLKLPKQTSVFDCTKHIV